MRAKRALNFLWNIDIMKPSLCQHEIFRDNRQHVAWYYRDHISSATLRVQWAAKLFHPHHDDHNLSGESPCNRCQFSSYLLPHETNIEDILGRALNESLWRFYNRWEGPTIPSPSCKRLLLLSNLQVLFIFTFLKKIKSRKMQSKAQ